jgi:hypothetical protein
MAKKARKTTKPSDALRAAIADSGRSLYRVAKDAGVDYSILHRFMASGRGLAIGTLDRLCQCLGLELKKSTTERS